MWYLNSKESLHKYYGCFLDEDLLLNWDAIKVFFSESIEDTNIHDNRIEWFNEKIEYIFPIYLDSCFHLNDLDNQNLKILLEKYSLWTNRNQEMLNFLEHLLTENSTRNLEGILYFSSIFERALGNVYLLKGKNVPHLLRDLLNTDEIKTIFGNIPITFTQILLGTPKSLNLRNLVWHGFPRNDELHFCYVSILLSIVLSFGKILIDSDINCENIPKRQQLNNLNTYSSKFLACYDFILPDIYDTERILFDNFYLKAHMSVFNDILQLFKTKQNGRFLLLLLPQFENYMRCIFCDINKMPERLLTAEMNTLYTTLDNIFAVKLEDGTANEIYNIFDKALIELYNDLFTYQAGPRIRDRLSHGEINFDDITDQFVQIVFSFFLLFVIKINCLNENHSFNYNKLPLIPLLKNYNSLYHPNSILKYKVLELHEKQYITIPALNSDLELQSVETDNIEIICKKFLTVLKTLLNSTNDPFVDLNLLHVPTINRLNEETEFISLLTRVICTTLNATEVIQNVLLNKYDLYVKRQLRTRQRQSFNRMLSLIPFLYKYFKCICYTVACFTIVAFRFDSHFENLDKFSMYFKKMLQSVETIESNILLDKNRWDLMKSLVDDCLKSTNQLLEQKTFKEFVI